VLFLHTFSENICEEDVNFYKIAYENTKIYGFICQIRVKLKEGVTENRNKYYFSDWKRVRRI
jgi:hypothetical protein